MNGRPRAHGVQIRRLGRILTRIALRHHKNRLLLAQRLNQLDRAIAPHRQRQHRMRKEDGIPYRQHRNRPFPHNFRVRSLGGLCCGRLYYAYKIIWH